MRKLLNTANRAKIVHKDLLPNRILFCGDTHGNFQHIVDVVNAHAPAAIVLLGDVQAQNPLEQELAEILDKTEVWFIPGNHDTDSAADHDNLWNSALADRNLHGRVVEVAGVRIAGLGGILREQIWSPPTAPAYNSATEFLRRQKSDSRWQEEIARKHRSSIFPDDYKRLACECADVLVTHEAPGVHPYGFGALDELAALLHVNTTFHGHHHDCLDYSSEWKSIGHRVFGVGFCGITALDGTVIRQGDFDQNKARAKSRLVCRPTFSSPD